MRASGTTASAAATTYLHSRLPLSPNRPTFHPRTCPILRPRPSLAPLPQHKAVSARLQVLPPETTTSRRQRQAELEITPHPQLASTLPLDQREHAPTSYLGEPPLPPPLPPSPQHPRHSPIRPQPQVLSHSSRAPPLERTSRTRRRPTRRHELLPRAQKQTEPLLSGRNLSSFRPAPRPSTRLRTLRGRPIPPHPSHRPTPRRRRPRHLPPSLSKPSRRWRRLTVTGESRRCRRRRSWRSCGRSVRRRIRARSTPRSRRSARAPQDPSTSHASSPTDRKSRSSRWT